MSTTGLEVFDTTLQQTNGWLKALMEALETDNRREAYSLLRATLHALRDRLGPENAVHLGAQLPMLLRGIYYEGWRLSETPSSERHVPDFLDHVRRELPEGMKCDLEKGVRLVFELMWRKIDAEEVAKIIRIVPRELKDLWMTSAWAD